MAAKVGDIELVGQFKCIEKINAWKNRQSFPHFLLVVGDVGSGRKTLSYLFAQELDGRVSTVPDVSVASIRKLVNIAYDIDSTMVYLIPNADGMSLAAKNSLLKLTEEPPENAYIILTLESLENTLPTLVSRSQHLIIDPYTEEQLSHLTADKRISRIATTPGMVNTLEELSSADIDDMTSTCDKLLNYIDKVSVANALKSAQKIRFKESDKAVMDIPLFIATMNYVAISKLDQPELVKRIREWMVVLSKYTSMMKRSGVNKKALYDKMILNVRNNLMAGGC